MAESTRTSLAPTTSISATPTNAQAMRQLWHWFLPANILAGTTRHGNCTWQPNLLVIQTFLWAWSGAQTLTEAFDEATQYCRTLMGDAALSTYQGFMNALGQWSPLLITNLITTLRQHAQEIGGEFWKIGQWVAIGFDGSQSAAPRTKSNEAAYCAANYGKGKTAKYRKKKTKGMRRQNNQNKPAHPPQPRVWITMLWHMSLRLPWAWRLGPSNSSERDHVMTMIAEEQFPEATLFCGDAGFIGYPLWSGIVQKGHHFLVRVGANVRLLVETLNGRIVTVGQDQFVYCWPQEAQREGKPPLQLRLVCVSQKKSKVWLLTSVLDATKLSSEELSKLYRMRWGIEVEFRGLKQTLDRAELRSRNETRVHVELDWSILGMAVAELWALKEQLNQATQSPSSKYTPVKRSLAETTRALRWCLRNLREVSESSDGLVSRLSNAVTDDYERSSSKQARYRPANPDKKPLGDPKLRRLTTEERQKLHEKSLNLAA